MAALPLVHMAEIGVRQFMADHEGELRIRPCGSQYAGRNHDAIVRRERVQAGVDLKIDGYGAGNHRSDRTHLVDAIPTDQDLDRLLAIVAHIAADPPCRPMARDRLIIESQELITGFDARDRSR